MFTLQVIRPWMLPEALIYRCSGLIRVLAGSMPLLVIPSVRHEVRRHAFLLEKVACKALLVYVRRHCGLSYGHNIKD